MTLPSTQDDGSIRAPALVDMWIGTCGVASCCVLSSHHGGIEYGCIPTPLLDPAVVTGWSTLGSCPRPATEPFHPLLHT